VKEDKAYQVCEYQEDLDDVDETRSSSPAIAAQEYAERESADWAHEDRSTLDVYVQESGKSETRKKFVCVAHFEVRVVAREAEL